MIGAIIVTKNLNKSLDINRVIDQLVSLVNPVLFEPPFPPERSPPRLALE